MDEDRVVSVDVLRTAACRNAEAAESIASTFEEVASTYRGMADRTRLPEATVRLVGHVARLQDRADHERAEAERLRHMFER